MAVEKIAMRLKQLRAKRAWTQERLAEKAGIIRGYLAARRLRAACEALALRTVTPKQPASVGEA